MSQSQFQALSQFKGAIIPDGGVQIRSDINRLLNAAFTMRIPIRVQSCSAVEWINIVQPSQMLIPYGSTFENSDFDAAGYVERQSGLEIRDIRIQVRSLEAEE